MDRTRGDRFHAIRVKPVVEREAHACGHLRVVVCPVKIGATVTLEDWLAFGLPRRSDQTVEKYRSLSDTHIVPKLGARRLRDLSASEVDRWLAGMPGSLSTRSIRKTRSVLSRAVSGRWPLILSDATSWN